jgi:hypothetical protein
MYSIELRYLYVQQQSKRTKFKRIHQVTSHALVQQATLQAEEEIHTMEASSVLS